MGDRRVKANGDTGLSGAPALEAWEDLDPILQRVGDARLVLLGEASHGTSEYYTWRRRLTERLVREKGFRFVAAEADWSDGERLDRYIKNYRDAPSNAREVLQAPSRWPTWMWGNRETVELAATLRRFNDAYPLQGKIGFYGLDVYGLWDSLQAAVRHLERVDPEAAAVARDAYECFEPYAQNAQRYARAARGVPERCQAEVVRLLAEMRRSRTAAPPAYRESAFHAEQHALVVANAERYYRALLRGDAASWNVRDTHMADTLDRLLDYHGPDAKGIVWAHNTHIGDARATDMADAGLTNLGQLARERHGEEEVVLVGFGTHHGHVVAARAWEAPWDRMPVPPARHGSLEDILHRQAPGDRLLVLTPGPMSATVTHAAAFNAPLGHRAIGVVYRPELEEYGNYVPTVLERRYDAFIEIDETEALRPLHVPPRVEATPETFPTGV
jgi:erythromycin esterase